MHSTCALLASMYLLSCMTYTPHSQEGATTLRHKEYQNRNLPALDKQSNTIHSKAREETIQSIAAITYTHTTWNKLHTIQDEHADVRFQLTNNSCSLHCFGWSSSYPSMAEECTRCSAGRQHNGRLAMVLQHRGRLAMILHKKIVIK